MKSGHNADIFQSIDPLIDGLFICTKQFKNVSIMSQEETEAQESL